MGEQWRGRPGPLGCSSSRASALGPRGKSWSPRPPTRMMVGESCLVSDRISAFPYVLLIFLVCCVASFYGRPGFDWARGSGFCFAAALGVWVQ